MLDVVLTWSLTLKTAALELPSYRCIRRSVQIER